MSTTRIREALKILEESFQEATGTNAVPGEVASALREVEAIEQTCKEAYRNDVNHDLLKSDSGVDLGLLVESIAKDAP